MNTLSNANANLIDRIWRLKYRKKNESTIEETFNRVANAIYKGDTDEARNQAVQALIKGKWAPGGRIIAGAGSGKNVTLINCFVNHQIDDDMSSIFKALQNAAITMQHGGGIGTDFSTLRPRNAIVRGVGGKSRGVIPFMEIWDAMCKTIVSAGSRRGAMMGVLSDDHPDLLEFIKTKNVHGRLTTFNISVLVSDKFMHAVERNEQWQLGFSVPPADNGDLTPISRDGKDWYIYNEVSARELWSEIINSTYEYSEPGVIFIDKVNSQNNLSYIEDIHCTNPCGEQPLPPNGDCNLGAVVLPRFVKNPFSTNATILVDELRHVVSTGVRFLDNVIDRTNYPQKEQEEEAKSKRRIGLGVTGLANMFQMMQVRYGDDDSITLIDRVLTIIRDEAYLASTKLASEREPFPLFDRDKFLGAPFVKTLNDDIRQKIYENGIRNGVLLTIAPTGTTSILFGNVSSGIEPSFSFKYSREFINENSDKEKVDVVDFGFEVWESLEKTKTDNDYSNEKFMVTTEDLSLDDHIKVQSQCQKYIDASISKTINCSRKIDLESFKKIYMKAYELECKSCTTYRPSKIRGSVLSKSDKKEEINTIVSHRPIMLGGRVYKISMRQDKPSYYLTVADMLDDENRPWPFEVFINRYDPTAQDWVNAFCVILSAVLREDFGDGSKLRYVLNRLKRVMGDDVGTWVQLPNNSKSVTGSSVVAIIAQFLEYHIGEIGESQFGSITEGENKDPKYLERCESCGLLSAIIQEDCKTCISCGFSSCG